jgi:hypothetical protein
MGRHYKYLTTLQQKYRDLPRQKSFWALRLKESPELQLQQYHVYKVRKIKPFQENMIEVYMPNKYWSDPTPFFPDFEPRLYYKPPIPKKKKWKLEIFVPNPRLVKRKNSSYGGT